MLPTNQHQREIQHLPPQHFSNELVQHQSQNQHQQRAQDRCK